MDLLNLIFVACALSMDAFAVSLCKGYSVSKLKLKHYLIVGCYFGGAQTFMVGLGYFIGKGFDSFVSEIDHWIAFALLTLIGAKMIKESRENKDLINDADQFGFKVMFALAVATSIDALAVGVSFAFLNVNLSLALFLIGFITFLLCVFALKIGNQLFGIYFRSKAEFLGGLVLILLGLKILINDLFFA